MARAFWSGAIQFGLVTIPVKLHTAVRESEGIHFHLLHAKDKGRIHNEHTCEIDGKKVPWSDVVRGYEYEKGRYLVVKDEELKKFRPEATQSIDIREFVDETQVDPIYFDKPYYVEPDKKGRRAYALLRDALRSSKKVGIAEVVLRTRQYVAAVKPEGDALVLELMHFADEIVKPSDLDLPRAQNGKEKTNAGEMKAAMMLIDSMSKDFDPGEFHDTYAEELRKHLEARAHGEPEEPARPARAPKATNVVDLVEVLQKSLQSQKSGGKKAAGRSTKAPANRRTHRRAS